LYELAALHTLSTTNTTLYSSQITPKNINILLDCRE